jgi:hypothetical protein
MIFLCPEASKLSVLGPSQPLIQQVANALSSEVKRLGREGDHFCVVLRMRISVSWTT